MSLVQEKLLEITLNINNIKSTYGYLGFTPFALLSITPWITGGQIGETAIIFQIAYGSIILSFLAGIPWGWRDDQPEQNKNLSIGIIYSLIACSMLILIYLDMILLAASKDELLNSKFSG